MQNSELHLERESEGFLKEILDELATSRGPRNDDRE